MWVSEEGCSHGYWWNSYVSILIWLDVGFGVYIPLPAHLVCFLFQSLFDWMWVSELLLYKRYAHCLPVSILIWLDVGFGERIWPITCQHSLVSILIWLDVGFGGNWCHFVSLSCSSFNPYLTGCGFRSSFEHGNGVRWIGFNPYLTGCGFRSSRQG